ncbi:MAG: type III-B CRISPR-associated protein Cas10/Cmr2 [Bacteroidetes bacterium]|nr:type III-B CRISPR-associated protein Cas10/Cmr2 [Bacteroidota bacterium]
MEEKENPIIKISPFLDSFELSPQFVSLESTNPLFAFLADVQKNGFLVEHYEEQDANGNVRFESLVEIATRGLQAEPIYRRNFNAYNWQNPKPEDEDKAEADFMEILSQDRTVFRSYHKYICIVKADGDKIGQTLKKIHGEKLIQFSKKLLNWGLAAKDKIRAFGGVPIYVGGDDLLFFAPVCTAAGTIIDLLDSIDTVFADQQWHEISQEVTPSLSYGLSISYYKFPLGEAIQKADALLYDAKRAGGNAVALKLLKHSGSEFEMVLQKSDSLYHYHFKNLLKRMVSDKAFLNSVGFKLRDNQSLIGHIAQDAVRMENLFHNVFDERATNRQDTDEYLKEVRELVTYSFGQHQNVVEESMKEVFSLIRTSKFINGLEEIKS